jgi:tetratricopeptide (TPR) repeat protein
MKSFVFPRAVIAASALIFAAPAFAQATAPQCDPTANVGGTAGRALFSMSRAVAAVQGNGAPLNDLKTVVKLLADDKTDDPVARDYMLGEAYILLLSQPGITPMSPRSTFGLTTNPTGTIDLFAGADSAFTRVVTAKPECATLVGQWRQQKPWLSTLNQAITALNAGQVDSAEYYAKRSLILDRRAPYGYSIMGAIAARRNDLTTANDYWAKTLEAASRDTLYNDVKIKTMYDIANAAGNAADAAPAANKAALTSSAIKAWKNYLGVATSDYLIADAVDRLERLYRAAGDTASIPSVYAALLSDPSKYGELSLVHAGVLATRVGRPADAAKLFEASLAANPYSRDALNNLAASYIQLQQYPKAFPLIDRLVALDPSNPDNVLLYAFAYQGLYKTTKDKIILKKYTDSLVYFNGRSEAMPVKVAITEFSRNDNETTLGGTIENRSAAAKTYDVSVEFLDKAGAVVGSQDVQVPVAPKATGKFRVTIPKGGVYGFRYKPLS